jgi:hypothetical protein
MLMTTTTLIPALTIMTGRVDNGMDPDKSTPTGAAAGRI